MQLQTHQLSYRYEDAPDLALTPVSATFPAGWSGIVGSNGSGKSTLLQVLCGQLRGYSGSINPAQYRSIYCAQTTDTPPVQAQDFALDYSSDAVRIRRNLGISEDWVWRFDTLSHGERKRLQIGTALWQQPDVLALDEPTNHIDAATRAQLITALKQFAGVGLLVSHDRELLDDLVSQCLYLSPTRAVVRKGNYTQTLEQEELAHTTAVRERKRAKAEVAHLKATHLQRAQEASRADGKRSARNLAKGDSDGRARLGLAIVSGKDGQAGRLKAQMEGRMAAAQQRLDEAFVEKSYAGTIWLDTNCSRRRVVLEAQAGTLPMGAERTLAFPDLSIGRTDKIGLTGQNGTGKSTLIRYLRNLAPEGVSLLYLPQELDTAESQHLLARLKALPNEEQGRVLSMVARLNSPPARILAGVDLSPGELRKVMLALGVAAGAQLIIADEPTNHLDLNSLVALEDLLRDYPGALLLVSHDAPFLTATCKTKWQITADKATTNSKLTTHS